MKCWAKCLGDCSGVQSGEHYFSASLFRSGRVLVEGVPWQAEEKKEYPISALTANILCEGHNNRLSTLDSEANTFWDKLERLNRLQKHRDRYPKVKSWNFVSEFVNGPKFERWVAKTAVNLFCIVGKSALWQKTKSPPIDPPPFLVESIYGRTNFAKPMGLYVRATQGDSINYRDTVGFQTIFFNTDEFVGGIVSFKGFQFLIWFSEDSPDFIARFPYRLQKFLFTHSVNGKNRPSHALKFQWPS